MNYLLSQNLIKTKCITFLNKWNNLLQFWVGFKYEMILSFEYIPFELIIQLSIKEEEGLSKAWAIGIDNAIFIIILEL